MEMYKVKLYGIISNVILKDHKKHYKLQGDVGVYSLRQTVLTMTSVTEYGSQLLLGRRSSR